MANLPYPRNFEEFLDWFPTEDDCLNYIEKTRWPDGFTCAICGCSNVWRSYQKRLNLKGQ
ncbi:MAG: transposase [Planctomycetes bacterium]|nr:transposase [Planctomycetota bacterium]